MTGPIGSTAPAIVVTPQGITPRGITPEAAARAYRSVDSGDTAGGSDFGSLLSRAAQDAVRLGQNAETQATQALAGGGNLAEVVQAVSRAELTLQTTTAIRDRVVQAYQDIMKMPI